MNLRKGTVEDPLAYKNREQYQFVTVTKDFMAFGYGRHAWYVENEPSADLDELLLTVIQPRSLLRRQ